jgi:peptidyl-prolyl cis-trans isomerase A (cyclophilin A)
MIVADKFSISTKWLKHSVFAFVAGSSLLVCLSASATTVQVQTVLGNFEVNLFDKTTPKTVENFVAYVNANAYANNVVHRSETGFVIQAGGFTYSGSLPLAAVVQNAPVVNEPVYSSLRGTIAMAKLGSNPNSATSQWFVNLADNSQNLDKQNGGFTVFGQVTGNGMAVVDAIAALSRFDLGGALTAMPLRNYTTADAIAGKLVTVDNLMLIQNVVVLNADPDTAANLTPVKNTLLNATPPASSSGDSSSGSGSFELVGLMALGLLALSRLSWLRAGMVVTNRPQRRRKIKQPM